MVSSINSVSAYDLTGKMTASIGTKSSIDSSSYEKGTATSTTDTTSSTTQKSSSSESKSLIDQLKEATSGFSACSSCGALFVGKTPPAICSKCGGKTTDENNETSKVSSTSDTTNNATNTPKTNAIGEVSEIVPSTIKL